MEEERLSRAVGWLAGAGRVAVLTGAGISKESGIPTFRDAQTGMWERYDPQTLASREGFQRDPGLVWRWYAWRAALVRGVAPNAGHEALARLGQLKRVTLITQNVDGLHQQAGSREVLELHGNVRRYKCFARDHPMTVENFETEEPPTCPRCGSLARPDVVWFGEMLSTMILDRAIQAAHDCDVMLVVGTSGLVQPAASLPLYGAEYGARTIEINPETTPLTPHLDLHLAGAAGMVLPALIEGVAEALR